MINSTIANDRARREGAAMENFLESPNDESFTEVFLTFTPQLVSFFRSHGCGLDLSEDLSQEVMLTVYRKSTQIRDRTRFRAWLFTIGRHALYRHYGKQSPKVDTVDLESVVDTNTQPAGPPAFEFHHWMSFLESREREALTLRFVEGWEYHEIAAAKAIPIGTVQWRVFNAMKKLATHLKAPELSRRKAA
jgi:RNA polymerase sigma factor (sigma-70 family)